MADILKISWVNGIFPIDFFSNDTERYGNNKNPNYGNITNRMNHLWLDNGFLKNALKIDGFTPTFKDKNGEIINKMHSLYETLSYKENIDFIVQRMKECEIFPTGLIAKNYMPDKEQFDKFCQFSKMFMDESASKTYNHPDPNRVTQFIIEPNHNLVEIKYTSRDKVAPDKVIKEMRKQMEDINQKIKTKFDIDPLSQTSWTAGIAPAANEQRPHQLWGQ
jgi:hypothetical protein